MEVKTKYKDWFPRMCAYGFEENVDYALVAQKRATNNPKNPTTTYYDHEITVDMAKELCMIQRNDKGKQARQYFLDLEKDWNSPEKVMARALILANKKISEREIQIEEMKPKVLFADSVETSKTTILVGDLAKLLKQNGVEIGQKRLFQWMRDNGYLIKQNGISYNMPTQYAMERGLFEVKETTIQHTDGHTAINKTTKVTGKGQIYFVNKFLNKDTEVMIG